jgi:microcystin-dependent protein
MALDPNTQWPTKTAAPSAAYPYGSAQDVTTPGDGTGTPWVADILNDWWGFAQHILEEAGITASGDPDEVGTSQYHQAIRRVSGFPGQVVASCVKATNYARVIKLHGQVIEIADFTDLVAATYCGDGSNATASAFYKTSDSGGTTRSTSGDYFVLPDSRGYFLRGIDASGTIDPEGAGRDYGNLQQDELQKHSHAIKYKDPDLTPTTKYGKYNNLAGSGGITGAAFVTDVGDIGDEDALQIYADYSKMGEDMGAYDTTENVGRVSATDTRPKNMAVDWLIWY